MDEADPDSESTWPSTLYSTVKYLRKQCSLIEEMGSKSPYHINIWWSLPGKVVAWYSSHSCDLDEYLANRDKGVGEDTTWWLQNTVLDNHFLAICKTMADIQGRTMLCASRTRLLIVCMMTYWTHTPYLLNHSFLLERRGTPAVQERSICRTPALRLGRMLTTLTP
jgi:hypothetical protein